MGKIKDEYDRRLAEILGRSSGTALSVVADPPYQDAGDEEEDELTDEELQAIIDKAKKTNQPKTVGKTPAGIAKDDAVAAILAGHVVFYDLGNEMWMAQPSSVGGHGSTMVEDNRTTSQVFDEWCGRAAGLAQEVARRLARNDANSLRWQAIASAGPETPPSTILQGMLSLLDAHHYGSALVEIAEACEEDIARHHSMQARKAAVQRHTRNALPAETRWKPVKRPQKPAQGRNPRSAPAPARKYDVDGTLLVDLGRGLERADGTGRPPLGRASAR